MRLHYNIDLQQYAKIRSRNYLKYSKSELGENLLWGNVFLFNKKGDVIIFKADLIKFSYELFDSALEIFQNKTKEADIYNMYQLYHLNLIKMKKKMMITVDNGEKLVVDNKKLLSEINKMKTNLLEDVKILFPNYLEMKHYSFLQSALKLEAF